MRRIWKWKGRPGCAYLGTHIIKEVRDPSRALLRLEWTKRRQSQFVFRQVPAKPNPISLPTGYIKSKGIFIAELDWISVCMPSATKREFSPRASSVLRVWVSKCNRVCPRFRHFLWFSIAQNGSGRLGRQAYFLLLALAALSRRQIGQVDNENNKNGTAKLTQKTKRDQGVASQALLKISPWNPNSRVKSTL